MNTCKSHMKLAGILLGLLVALPISAVADKERKPNAKSVATTAACINKDGDVEVYSCKGLSNVVLWCGNAWVKHDDIADEDGNEIYQDAFGCVDADGNDIGGDIIFVAVKSGSQKHAKHNDGYMEPGELPDDPPSGSGLFMEIESCDLLAADSIPMPGECVIKPTEPPDPLPGA